MLREFKQSCELETRFNCSVACHLSTAFFRTLKKTTGVFIWKKLLSVEVLLH